ncbi:hypothetical protein [Allgaiera indica]|nr:hypothetical protein [Allgaiera indica]
MAVVILKTKGAARRVMAIGVHPRPCRCAVAAQPGGGRRRSSSGRAEGLRPATSLQDMRALIVFLPTPQAIRARDFAIQDKRRKYRAKKPAAI